MAKKFDGFKNMNAEQAAAYRAALEQGHTEFPNQPSGAKSRALSIYTQYLTGGIAGTPAHRALYNRRIKIRSAK